VATHYETLGVPRTATPEEIRRAYHSEARRWHPDRSAGRSAAEAKRADEAMRRVNEAWRVLGDPARRRDYDRSLYVRPVAGSGVGAAGGGSPRIDPRLLDPEYLAARRRAQEHLIDRRQAAVVRIVPWLAVLGLLAGIFVVTAYARPQPVEVAVPTTVAVPAPPIGARAGECVRIGTGPSLLPVPCDGARDGYVVGVKLDADQPCPAPSVREVVLRSGVIVCLGP
jgi:hypothetical protein